MKTGIFLAIVLVIVLSIYGFDLASNLVMAPIMMAIIAFSLLSYSVNDYRMVRRRKWPYSAGRIVAARFVPGGFFGQKVSLEYSYRVNDREYVNSVFDFSQKEALVPQLRRHLDLRYDGDINALVGRQVKVFYDKEAPYVSALCNKYSSHEYVTVIPALIVIAFSVFSLGVLAHKMWGEYFVYLL